MGEAGVSENPLLPEHGKNCFNACNAALAQRFPTCEAFASTILAGIYTLDKIDQALELKATTLACMVCHQ